MEAVSFRDEFGVLPAVEGEGAALKGLRLAVADLDATERVLRAGGLAPERHIGRLVLPAQAACGATLIFEPPGRA